MVTVRQTRSYALWFAGLRDERVKSRIIARIKRLTLGNPGDYKPVGEGVSELRIDVGPGYRVYFAQRGSELVILLCGDDKSSQTTDIAEARILAKAWRSERNGS